MMNKHILCPDTTFIPILETPISNWVILHVSTELNTRLGLGCHNLHTYVNIRKVIISQLFKERDYDLKHTYAQLKLTIDVCTKRRALATVLIPQVLIITKTCNSRTF